MAHLILSWLLLLNSRRYRRILIACLATLGISALSGGSVLLVRWKSFQAVRGDTRVILNQAGQQLLRALQSRRGTLTLLRETLEKAPQLNILEQKALAKSAVAHTRHLLGIGWIGQGQPLIWWAQPAPMTTQERARLDQSASERARMRNVWRVPSTWTVSSQRTRPLLVMLEPLRAPANRSSAVVGVFDLAPLLADFFELSLQQPYPVQLLEENRIVYRSSRWQPSASGQGQSSMERPINLDAVRWVIQMQPGTTQTAQTISAIHSLLIGFSLLASIATIGLIWLLVMRTWILQRAVSRRTAALRRATEHLRQLATTDELTGLHNRRFFLERWQWEYQRAKRYKRPLMCLMIDVNEFKRINDMLGHHMGDMVLKQVAQELKSHLRHSDIVARFGGDEFIAALPETSLSQAALVAEKLRQVAIAGPWASHPGIGPVRLSVGVGRIQPGESPQKIIQEADAALYASRQAVREKTPVSMANA